MSWDGEWPQPVKLTADEEKLYLEKVNNRQVTVDRAFLMQINICLKLYGSSLHSRGKSTKFPGLLSNKLTEILRIDRQSKPE